MSKPRKPPETLWRKATYIAANDITAVALYRIASGFIALTLVGMMSYFGNRVIVGQDQFRDDINKLRTEISLAQKDGAGVRATLDMTNRRIDRTGDRLNNDENRITTLEARMDFLLMQKR